MTARITSEMLGLADGTLCARLTLAGGRANSLEPDLLRDLAAALDEAEAKALRATKAAYAAPTSDGSFSAVWTATIASKDAFFCIFRDLQDLHSFAPLQSQILQIFRNFFRENFRIFSDFCKILLNFCEISTEINNIFDANL